MRHCFVRARRGLAVTLLAACTAGADAAWAADSGDVRLYRYRNDKGTLVIDDKVPPEYADRGYEVVTQTGRVIETVPPALSEEQRAQRRAEQEAAEEARRIREWEKRLLRHYRSVEEIEAARDRVLREYQGRINILRGNLASQRSHYESQQARAANLERQGRQVHDSIRENIEALRRDIATTEANIQAQERELEEIRQQFDRDIARFKKMMERLGRRGEGVTAQP